MMGWLEEQRFQGLCGDDYFLLIHVLPVLYSWFIDPVQVCVHGIERIFTFKTR